jgi:fumarylacetoacetate (FAA) hydrolase family protein
MGYTMLRQMSRQSRVLARQHDNNMHDDPGAMQILDTLLNPEKKKNQKSSNLE